jgi:PIN domain nuclease of toxin-antitoxin system
LKSKAIIDTHIFLWFVNDDAALTENVKSYFASTDVELYLSDASVWEMAIKFANKKLELPEPPDQFVRRQLEINRVLSLPITQEAI